MNETAAPQIRHITPGYDRAQLKPRILHIGFGAFSRAFLGTYLDEALTNTPAGVAADWGMVAARLNSGAGELEALAAADHAFGVLEADDETLTLRRIGAICGVAHPAFGDGDTLFKVFENPELAIVSLTITEKGYCTDGRGHLDTENAAINRDLTAGAHPSSAPGVIVEGLARRKALGLSGLTILCCDNLPDNGHVCGTVIRDFAALKDKALLSWIEENVTFPSTMVDRIVPAMTDESAAFLAAINGSADTNGMVCEPFRQWVIEDNFTAGRPAFERAGAQMVADVRPFEDMKLRMLNGSHSFLAYLGALAGHETISDCMGDEVFREGAHDLMLKEQRPTLDMPEGTDLEGYAAELIARFSNSRLKHKTTQIANDGSQKLPQRLLASIRYHLKNGSPYGRLALGVAGWMAYARGTGETGESLPLNDPLASQIRDVVASNDDGDAYVEAMLALNTVFPEDLTANTQFAAAIKNAYHSLREIGARKTIETLSRQEPTS